jgi:hypothetical protein
MEEVAFFIGRSRESGTESTGVVETIYRPTKGLIHDTAVE